jgi:hypothetical protein
MGNVAQILNCTLKIRETLILEVSELHYYTPRPTRILVMFVTYTRPEKLNPRTYNFLGTLLLCLYA